MTAFVTALFAEGRTDERFLPRIIQRTAADLLARRGRRVVDVLEPTLLEPDSKSTRADDMLAAARKAAGYHILFIHADADASTHDAAFNERFAPGLEQVYVAKRGGETICTDLVPVIPIHKVEAWLLADAHALMSVIGTHLSADDLGIPLRANEVEGIATPKQRLSEIVQQAISTRTRRRRRLNIGELYEPLADQIRLENLSRLPAFERFSSDLAMQLDKLGFLT